MPDSIPYDDWFHKDYKNPLDSMPIATNDPYDPPEGEPLPELEEEEITPHEEAYRIATAKYNPFSIGGSENIHDFDSKD